MRSEHDQALTKALRKLRAADRFEEEIRGCLTEFDAATRDEVVAYLKENGLLDDQRTSRLLVGRFTGKRAIGKAEIARRLVARGASEGLANEVTALADDGEAIREILATRFVPDNPDRGRASRFLTARGFDADLVESAVERFFSGEE